jgi:hypothetical protein
MRPSSSVLSFFAFCVMAMLLTLVDAGLRRDHGRDALARRAHLVGDLQLTDLALFTEARYTRHLSQSDLHAAFQDHPSALEHFPSGSLVPPPRRELP